MIKLSVALAFLGLNFYTYHYLATDPVYVDRESFEEFPDQLGSWTCPERMLIEDDAINNLGVTDYLIQALPFTSGEIRTTPLLMS